jgi:hypothetical protein
MGNVARRFLAPGVVAALTAAMLTVPAAGAAAEPAPPAPPACAPPVPSETRPGYTVADPNCDVGTGARFAPLSDPAGRPLSRVHAGIRTGAAYRIEVPLAWNGELVVYAHGYRGTGTTVFVDNPALRAHYVARGFAWAASSYQTNGYDVGQGVRDSHAMIDVFREVAGRPARAVYLTGASMGGHITAVAIEHYRTSFVGAMPYCGVLGDVELFDYFLDVNVTAAALADVPIDFPLQPPPDAVERHRATVRAALPRLGSGWGAGTPPTLTDAGRRWAGVVEQRSGGERPGFDAAFAYWNSVPGSAPLGDVPFLFSVYPGISGGSGGIAPGNVTTNRFTLYQTDASPWLSWDEWVLNAKVLRVDRTAQPSRDLTGVPKVTGDPRIPVLSLHNLGDLFVPFSMEQVYAARAALHGRGGNVVSRAVRSVPHCDFTGPELQRGFDDLVQWVRGGHRPAGDAILDRRAVARPDFGCRFTVGERPSFGESCPRP